MTTSNLAQQVLTSAVIPPRMAYRNGAALARLRGSLGIVLTAALVIGGAVSSRATTIVSAASGYWTNSATWAGASVPGAGAQVALLDGHEIVLNPSPANLTSLSVSNGATLNFRGWETVLTAGVVNVYGTMTHDVQSATQAVESVWIRDARVNIACDTLTVFADGKIDVDGKGFGSALDTLGFGPGHAKQHNSSGYSGASHGGRGGDYQAGYDLFAFGDLYGNADAPEWPGSGAPNSPNNFGGGVVRIDATGAVTVDGVVSADATYSNSNHGEGAASGGSVYITCATFAGSGTVSANGGDTAARNAGGGGGGGRIALHYTDAEAQSADVAVEFWLIGGYGGGTWDYTIHRGEVGTLYISGSKFFPRNPLIGAYHLTIPGFTEWTVNSLTVTNRPMWIQSTARPRNTAVRLPDDVHVTVNGDATIGADGILDLRGDANLTVDGRLVVTNGGWLALHAGLTNGITPHGLSVNVAGNMIVADDSFVFPHSHPTNGGSVRFSLGALTVHDNGRIDADRKGFGLRQPFGTARDGYGPGKGKGVSVNHGGGGGHGGQGASASTTATGGGTYGDPLRPTAAGSSGGTGLRAGGKGGGVVWVEAPNGVVRVDGKIWANGLKGHSHASGGGAGGSIFIESRVFSGGGELRALGGNGTGGGTGGGGGGGRIAVWGALSQWQGSPSIALTAEDYALSVTNGTSAGTVISDATPGTIVFRDRRGTLLLIR